MHEIIMFIQTLGFPVFVAIYLLIFMQKTLESNRKMLQELKDANELLRYDIHEFKVIVQTCQERGKSC